MKKEQPLQPIPGKTEIISASTMISVFSGIDRE